MDPLDTRIACDSLVALGSATTDGNTIFAKNSDRPAMESQPLFQESRQQHAPGAVLRCTYIEIPQVAETARVIGSRPFWCWGLEHGLNEHGVAIGNHTVFTKDPVSGLGLIGMDLVRLGLERSTNAAEALDVITSLLARYGQGGSGYSDKDWPYHNSFLIADSESAFVLETSDRAWAMRRVTAVASMSNHVSINADWDALAPGTVTHAIENGWWDANERGRFDFGQAYRDTSMAPPVISSGRFGRTCELLARDRGRISVPLMRGVLRDHYDSPTPRQDLDPSDERYFSVCMHADPVGTTTATMIASLSPNPNVPLVYWASLGSPCVGAFLPIFLDAELPAALTTGGQDASDDSAWWTMKRLLQWVEADWDARFSGVRTAMNELERKLAAKLATVGSRVEDHSAFVASATADILGLARRLAAKA